MQRRTVGILLFIIFLTPVIIAIFYLLGTNNIGTFNTGRSYPDTTRYEYIEMCPGAGNLYGGYGSNTIPIYSDPSSRIYWDTSALSYIIKDSDNTYTPHDGRLVPMKGQRKLVLEKNGNNYKLASSANNSLTSFTIPNIPITDIMNMAQPFDDSSLVNRNPNDLRYYDTTLDPCPSDNDYCQLPPLNTGSYITTEEDCMTKCKEDCIGYLMIPNAFSGGQPYCHLLDVNTKDLSNSSTIDLNYSCSPGTFDDPLNVITPGIYGRIKNDNIPLLKNRYPGNYSINFNLVHR